MKDNAMLQDVMLDLDIAWKKYKLLGIQVEIRKQRNAIRLMLIGSILGITLLILLAITYTIYVDDGVNNPWDIVLIIINTIAIYKMYGLIKSINYNYNQIKIIDELVDTYQKKIAEDKYLQVIDTFGNLISELKFMHKFKEEE